MPLQVRPQITRIKARVRDASLRRRPSELAREEQITDFALSVVVLHAFVLWFAVIGELHAVGPGRHDVQRHGAGPRDADGAFGGRSGRCDEDGLEEFVQQTRSEAIGADLEFVTMSVCATFGRKHDLCAGHRS